MKRYFFVSILVPIAAMAVFASAGYCQEDGTNIRGQVVTFNHYSQGFLPVPELRVDLMVFDEGTGEWIRLKTANTDPTGMFYMWNVRPGNYFLQVDGRKNYSIEVVPKEGNEFQDLPRINY